MQKIISVFLHIVAEVIIYALMGYIALWIFIYTDKEIVGGYSPMINMYVCELGLEARSNCIYHEQGHAYDSYNMPISFLWKGERSTEHRFRVDIDAINGCLTAIFDNYDILHTEYPKTSLPLMTVKFFTERYSDNEYERYGEIYAELYAIMKTYRWDEYHYDDVEDMTAQKVIACQRFLDENAETLRPRQN